LDGTTGSTEEAMTSTKWHTSDMMTQAEHDRRALIQGMKAAFAIEAFAALFGLLAGGGYWLGKHWRWW
jgi:hypothetical protein